MHIKLDSQTAKRLVADVSLGVEVLSRERCEREQRTPLNETCKYQDISDCEDNPVDIDTHPYEDVSDTEFDQWLQDNRHCLNEGATIIDTWE